MKKKLYIKAEKYFRKYHMIRVKKVHHVGIKASEVQGLKFHY